MSKNFITVEDAVFDGDYVEVDDFGVSSIGWSKIDTVGLNVIGNDHEVGVNIEFTAKQARKLITKLTAALVAPPASPPLK